MSDEIPPVLDWVKARADCSIETLFMQLIAVLTSDVQAIQQRAQGGRVYECRVVADDRVVVSYSAHHGGGIVTGDGIVFERTRNGAILVREGRSQAELFLATPDMSASGRCRLNVAGELLELWQVSRKALEPMFFPF